MKVLQAGGQISEAIVHPGLFAALHLAHTAQMLHPGDGMFDGHAYTAKYLAQLVDGRSEILAEL